MSPQDILGKTTMFLALAMVFLGFPAQLWKNYREKRCGMPLLLAVLAFSVYAARMAYAITIGSMYIWIPDLVGALFSAAILWQYWNYRKK